jgi:hypothetical protein
MAEPQATPRPTRDDSIPLFRSWPGIYAAVVVNALVWMALIALFAAWAY